MEHNKDYFSINVSKYDATKDFIVTKPASINHPQNNSVMFIKKTYMEQSSLFALVEECLIFWPDTVEVPEQYRVKNAFVLSSMPHIDFCRFFKENNIDNLPPTEEFDIIGGAFICKNAKIGHNCRVLPGAYISGGCVIGDNVYIGAGTKLVGEVYIGNNVVVRENSVIGADGLTTDRDTDNTALTMPQFGYIVIEDNVQVGSNTVIARGAIDATIIRRGATIDCSTFISHNTDIGENTFVVGETIMFGSSSAGKNCIISGNSTIANFVHIGDESILGMGAVATKSIPEYSVAIGFPAKVVRQKRPGEEV